MDNAYEVNGVWFKYAEQWVLEDVSLDIKSGEIFGIIGPNGSGKSSLLKLLSGLNIPQLGEIYMRGEDIKKIDQGALARTVAVVPQESLFVFPFTVAETVLMGRSPHMRGRFFENLHDLEVAERAMEWLDIVELADRPVTEISGGEKQRAIIARALAQEPGILILDEPTASLDIGHQIAIYDLLATLGALGTEFNSVPKNELTIVLSSHDLNLASQYCQRLMLLHQGSIYSVGTPSEVITEKNINAVYDCEVIVDKHPLSDRPRVTLSGRNSKQ